MRLSHLAATAMLGLFALGIAGAQARKPQPVVPKVASCADACDSVWTSPKTVDYSGMVVRAGGFFVPMSAKPEYTHQERRAITILCYNVDALPRTCHLAIALLWCRGSKPQLEAEVNEFLIEEWSDEQIVALSYDKQSTLTIYPKQKRVIFHDYNVMEAGGKVFGGVTDYELK